MLIQLIKNGSFGIAYSWKLFGLGFHYSFTVKNTFLFSLWLGPIEIWWDTYYE